jgi:acetyl esterase/lipase
MLLLYFFIVWLLFTWAVARFVLSGSDHAQFDSELNKDYMEVFSDDPDDQAANHDFLLKISAVRAEARASRSMKKGFQLVRKFADELSDDFDSDCTFTSVDIGGVKAEWTLAPDANPNRRVLLHHGGAFLLGSPKGHRWYSHQLSHIANAAVLSVDYRMLPKHGRSCGIQDAQSAYKFIVDNAPSEKSPAEFLLLAGDSAGGNLTMMLSSWSGEQNLRRPDGVIGFSPSLDMTGQSPTLKSNKETDPILGEGLGLLISVPYMFMAWLQLFALRMNPAHKSASPLFYSLNNLPKTLIHASSSEMLLGESIRYTNKAHSQGADIRLQVWENQLHDWHLFNRTRGSAGKAWSEVERFIRSL